MSTQGSPATASSSLLYIGEHKHVSGVAFVVSTLHLVRRDSVALAVAERKPLLIVFGPSKCS
jgi:hypothetical protein